MEPSLLFLIGYRGTGKSTVAALVAQRLGWDAVDADALLEERAGKSIRTIFAEDGEPAFRDLEARVLAELSERQRCVIATGGGVVLRPANRQRLKAGRVVWLTADVATLAARIHGDRSTAERRPALTVGGTAEIEELLRVREPLYRECADFTVDTVERTPDAVAAEICALLKKS